MEGGDDLIIAPQGSVLIRGGDGGVNYVSARVGTYGSQADILDLYLSVFAPVLTG